MQPGDRRILLIMRLRLAVGSAVVFVFQTVEPVMWSQSSLFERPALP